MTTENLLPEQENNNSKEPRSNSENKPIQNENTFENQKDTDKNTDFSTISIETALDEMEKIINGDVNFVTGKKFTQLKEVAIHLIETEKEKARDLYISQGNNTENFVYHNPNSSRLNEICIVYKEKIEEFQKKIEAEQENNKIERKKIIEDLHKLYTEATTDTNLFKEIRIIKERWANAGQVPKSDFKILNNDYFHHLNQFYQVLDLNKEYLEQEYSHNLEKRKHIINRAKELIEEPAVQKALNELQYLHKLWKEEAEPVDEEHRKTTWEEFNELSTKIHERKNELIALQEIEQKKNLDKKNDIIEQIKKLSTPKENGHIYWQNAIKKVEELRLDFIKTGSVPKKVSNENWNTFKNIVRQFNHEKNNYYKTLKNNQQDNLAAKKELLQKAKENAQSTDWENMLPFYKQLQEDWKKVGHVPKPFTKKLWEEFKEACNIFFDNYRTKNEIKTDNWKENFIQKNKILKQLQALEENENCKEELLAIKNAWEQIGKVPKDKMKINSDFNILFKKWAKKLNIKETLQSEKNTNPIDRARKLRTNITEIENQIVTLENNINFFADHSRENPLLKDTYAKIDAKKSQINEMKEELRDILRNTNE